MFAHLLQCDPEEAEKVYCQVLEMRQLRLACDKPHADGYTIDKTEAIVGALLDVARAQRHIGTVEKLAESYSNIALAAAALPNVRVCVSLQSAVTHFLTFHALSGCGCAGGEAELRKGEVLHRVSLLSSGS